MLPERGYDGTGERSCLRCIERRLVPVWMVFHQEHGLWHVAFFDEDGVTALPWSGRFSAHDKLYAIAEASYQPVQALRQLESRVKNNHNGRVKLRLTAAQYKRLGRAKR